MTKEEREEIFENIISGLRKKFIHSDNEQLDATESDKRQTCQKTSEIAFDYGFRSNFTPQFPSFYLKNHYQIVDSDFSFYLLFESFTMKIKSTTLPRGY